MAGKTSYYHCDASGNVRALTDSNQNVTDRYTYDAFGNTVAQSGTTENNFRFGGQVGYHLNPDSGSYYVRQREFQPAIIRWLSVDPIGLVDAMNLFLYVGNNPVIVSDPSGLQFGGGWGPVGPTNRPTTPSRPPSMNVPDCGVERDPYVAMLCICKCGRPLTTRDAALQAKATGDLEAAKIWKQDSNEQRGLRHCIASALLSLAVGADCADCIGTQRELYQKYCEGMSDFDYNLGVSYNRYGVLVGLKPGLLPLTPDKRLELIVETCKRYVEQFRPHPDKGFPVGNDPVTPSDWRR